MANEETEDERSFASGGARDDVDAAGDQYRAGNVIGPVARGLSQSLMQGAFEKFGQAFTKTGDVRADAASADSRLAPWRAQGAKAAGALELRWHTMEYENFQASAVEPYIAAKKEMLGKYKQLHTDLDSGIYMGPPGPDGLPQMQQLDVTRPADREQLMRLRGQIEKDFYGQNADMDIELYNLAHKYPGNPLISKRIEMIATSYSNQLMKATNPDQSLQAEGAASEITARMMNEDTKKVQAQANLKAAKQKPLAEPTDLRQVEKHPEIGGAGAMLWLVDSVAGEAVIYGNRGGDAMRQATTAYEKQLIDEDSTLAKEPDRLKAEIGKLQGKIRKLASSIYLKDKSPKMWAQSKEAMPHLFDFEKVGADPDGILNPTDERGVKGDERVSSETKKTLFEGWTTQWNTELDNWASDPSNELTPANAMEHMEQWIKNAISNGAKGVPNDITIAINERTKDLRAELISSLISQGGRTLMGNPHMREANPGRGILETVTHPFGGAHQIPSGRRGRMQRAAERKRRRGLLADEEDK